MKRKEFLKKSSVLLGATILGCQPKTNSNNSKKLSNCSFDMHTHPGAFFRYGTPEYGGDTAFIDRVVDMNTAGLDGAFFSLVSDLPLLRLTDKGIEIKGTFEKGEGWKLYKGQLAILKKLINQSKANLAVNASDLRDDDRVAAYISCEGGDFLDDDVDHLDEAFADGVRSVQLVHYAPNSLGDLQTWKAVHGGLSSFGKEVVVRMNKLGMVIDVAHASARTVKNVADMTEAPIILSHSIIKEENEGPMSSRAISEGHAKLVSNTGGVIGMWPSGFSSSLDEFVDATFKMVDVVGIDHVGLGTDMDGNFKPVISNYSEYGNWRDALANKGMSREEVEKVTGGNMQRVLNAILK